MEMHLIPTQKNAHGAGLYPEMVKLGVMVHEGYDWEAIPAGAPAVSYTISSPRDVEESRMPSSA